VSEWDHVKDLLNSVDRHLDSVSEILTKYQALVEASVKIMNRQSRVILGLAFMLALCGVSQIITNCSSRSRQEKAPPAYSEQQEVRRDPATLDLPKQPAMEISKPKPEAGSNWIPAGITFGVVALTVITLKLVSMKTKKV